MSHLYLKENGKWTAQNAELLYRKENGQWLKKDWSDLDLKNYVFKLLGPKAKVHYVSLGDSIAAGHSIDDNWATNYGEGSQYGYDFGNGYVRTEPTAIVPGSYTDLIRNELVNTYGADKVSAMSFAKSGDTVAMLMDKLSHATVRNAIEQADFVTICIGANDVLQPALSRLEEYISTGSLSAIEATIESNLARLTDDSNPNSFVSLFNRLAEINPYAKHVFTLIYNPYKFLHIEEGRNGFFGPLLNTIPDMTYGIPGTSWSISFGDMIKEGILLAYPFQLVYGRVNGLSDWAELRVNKLNLALHGKLMEYKAINSNFNVVYTKSLFDSFPDRPIDASRHYNDLVNVEFTRGYTTATMDWSALWRGSNAATFWNDLGAKHTYWINAVPSTNIWDYVDFHMEDFAADLVNQIIEKVIVPNVDPHPEVYGQYVIERAFADAFGMQSLEYYYITYDANGGTGTMEMQVLPTVDGLPAFTTLLPNAFTAPEGYYITGWNSEPDGSGIPYSLDMYVGIAGIQTMYAQWSKR